MCVVPEDIHTHPKGFWKFHKGGGLNSQIFAKKLGVNKNWNVSRGGRIGVCKSANPCHFFAKSVDPPKCLFKSETTTTSENRGVKVQTGKLVYVNGIVNSAQIVKKATYLWQQHSTIPITVSSLSLNEFLSQKEIIWTNSSTYRLRLKKDLWSKFH